MTASNTGHGPDGSDIVAAAGRAIGYDGVPVVGAHLLEATVDLLVTLNTEEHTRRIATNTGALDRWDWLRVLSGLPRWESVPMQSCTPIERQAIRDMQPGAVKVVDDTVTRLAAPPISGALAVVTDKDWDRGLNIASRFAPVATRMLVLEDEPADLAVAAAEATEYGIGLALKVEGDLQMEVTPEPWREQYFSVGGWLFREQAYRAYLSQSVFAQHGFAMARG